MLTNTNRILSQWLLSGVLFASPTAHAVGSLVFSNDFASLSGSFNLSPGALPNSQIDIGHAIDSAHNSVSYIGLTHTGKTQFNQTHQRFGIGPRLYQIKYKSIAGKAVALGGYARIPFNSKIHHGVVLQGYFAPKILSRGELDNLGDISVAIELEAIAAAPCRPVSFFPAELHMSNKTVLRLRKALLAKNLIREQLVQTSGRGRPSIWLALTPDASRMLGKKDI